MLRETWTDQYDRMQRSFELLRQIGEPTASPQNVIWPRDVVYHFCCDAFHLRDYIAANLGTDPATSREQIERELDENVIKPSEELSACRDVANGSKHLVLDGPTYLANGKHAEVVSHSVDIGVPAMTGHGSMPAIAADDPVVAQPPSPTPSTQATGSTGGYIQDTFIIDINGQHHDARDVGAKAIAAWDAWLKARGML